MILSHTFPPAAIGYCIACLLTYMLSYYAVAKFLPPQSSRHYTFIKLTFLLFILIVILYLGNIQYFLPVERSQMPLNVSIVRALLCYVALAAIAALGYGLTAQKAQQESEFIAHLMQEQHRQYLLRQDTLETLNRECHDLKHQLALFKASPQADCVQKMMDILTRHESIIQTGNSVLDLVLTEKQTVCTKQGIRLSYMIDPDALASLSSVDLCTIFDNAIDNAIEASMQVKDAQRRIIQLQATRKGKLLYIRVKNYYEHRLRWKEGELSTTKPNHSYHGYGIKSIRHAVTRYGGEMTLSTEDNWFSIGIVIPIE